MKEYIGIDIHRKFSEVNVMNESGEQLERRRLEHDDIVGLREYFEKYSGASAVMEATVGWMWLADELENQGIEVHLAHSSGVKLIASSKLKTDKVDAKVLAQLLRTGFLPEAYLAPLDVRVYREILRWRTSLVKMRAMAKNRIHGLLMRLNIQFEATDIFGKKGREMLRALMIEEPYSSILLGWLDVIDFLDGQVKIVEDKIRKAISKDKRVDLLMTMPGIGLITAYTIIAEVGEIERFRSDKAFASYCGLFPSTHQSASKVYHGRISGGRRTLEWCIVESCHTAVRRDSYFATIFNKHKRSKGNGRAFIIAAREMARIIYKMLKEERSYVPRPKQKENRSKRKTSMVGP